MCLPADSNVDMRGDKSFVYDLDVQRSIVSSRVALLLRSAEIKLQLSDLSTSLRARACGFVDLSGGECRVSGVVVVGGHEGAPGNSTVLRCLSKGSTGWHCCFGSGRLFEGYEDCPLFSIYRIQNRNELG